MIAGDLRSGKTVYVAPGISRKSAHLDRDCGRLSASSPLAKSAGVLFDDTPVCGSCLSRHGQYQQSGGERSAAYEALDQGSADDVGLPFGVE